MIKLKNGIRIWIATTSVTSFMGGWVLLAHSPKPASTINQPTISVPSQAPLPTLAPLPAINNQSIGAQQLQPLQPLQPAQPSPIFQPRMRTSGS